jgi:nucleoside-diphosphate-sugar epimerase
MSDFMKILITGGGGYIGSALLLRLQKEHDIASLDHGRHYDKLSGMVNERVSLVRGDILDRELVSRLMKGMDAVIHLAGGGGNAACMKDPARAVMTNIYGTHLLLSEAKKSRVKRFIFSSSYAVYPASKAGPFREDLEPEPGELYDALKASSEHEIRDSGVDYVIMRPTNVYGYGTGLGLEHGGVVNKFVDSAKKSSSITIYGTGKQRIDIIHIDDLCRAVSAIARDGSIRNEHFNIGSGKGRPVEEIAEMCSDAFKKLLNKNIEITRKPSGSFPERWVSIDNIKSRTGWKPDIRPEDGIRELIMKPGG